MLPYEIVWTSPCGRGRVEDRRGLMFCLIGGDHIGTQLSLEKAKALVLRKLGEAP